MITRIRFVTIVFAIVMLIAFGIIPYLEFSSNLRMPALLVIALFILFAGGMFSIIWLTLVIRIDKEIKLITFTYPFRFRKKTYKFSEILGFRFKYLNARVEYKAIQFKTLDGNKFTVSDFETSNIRLLEETAAELFELTEGKLFRGLSKSEKEREMSISKAFDVAQAKDIRFHLAIGLLVVLFFIFFTIYLAIKGNSISQIQILVLVISTILIAGMVKKLMKTHRFINSNRGAFD